MHSHDLVTFGMMMSRLPEMAGSLHGLMKAFRYGRFQDPARTVGLGWVLESTTAKHGNRPAVLYDDRRISYNDFNAWANRIARCLSSEGIRKGDTVAIFIENRPELLACVAGVAKLGGINAMVNTTQTGKVLIHSINLVKPRAIITGEELVNVIEAVRGSIEIPEDKFYFLADHDTLKDTGRPPAGYINLAEASAHVSSLNPETTGHVCCQDPCFYVYTSGTTGLPKAALFSHGRLMKGYGGFGFAATRMKPTEIMYSTLPLYHSTAMVICWGPCLISGAGFAIRRKFSVSEFWDDVRKFKADCFGYVGEICRYLMNQPETPDDADNPIYKMVGTGLRPGIWKAFKKRFGIERVYEAYASSEGPSGFINLFNFDNTVGICPDPFAIVRYDKETEQPWRNPRGKMERVKKGEAGLLITGITARGHFDGYTQKDKTDSVILRDVFRKGDAWYNTGDYMRSLGFRHAQFVDRLGDTFRWKGENVSTTEVENILGEFPNIAEAVVYGVEIPHTNGRAGMAAVTLVDRDAGLGYDNLYNYLKKSLPHYAIPVFIRQRIEMDTTGTFKYQKTKAKKDGFDVNEISDPVYIHLPGAKKYVPLSKKIHGDIVNGAYRF